MSRRHYVALARAIRATVEASECEPAARDWLSDVAGRIADELSADNPRFDRARFLRACGLAE